MAFDKAKVVRAAEKFLAQGKISAAIKEYRQIVDNDPDDFTALNMLGDLYARNGKKTEAITCFSRIAEHYRGQGFNLKAIAMYKKIDKLEPNDPVVARTLGGLYEMQGLIVDARAQYMVVADAFQRAGQPQKALEVLRKIADLAPQNTETRLKLAAGYLKENMREDAATAFAEAGQQFLAHRKFERALESYNETLKLAPRHRVALNGVLSAHIALGTADEAAELIEQAVAFAPEDIELVSMLTQAYIEADDPVRAEHATEALVAADESQCPRFLDVARLFLNEDHTEQSVRILSNTVDQMLAAGEVDAFLKLLEEILARHPEHIEGLKLLVKVHRWQCDDVKTRGALERLVETADACGNVDVERIALAQLAQIVPDVRYLDRLESLGGAPAEMRSDVRDEQTFAQPEIAPTFETFALINEPATHLSDTESSLVEEVSEFEWNTVEPSAVDPAASFADLNDEVSPGGEDVFETNSADVFETNSAEVIVPAGATAPAAASHEGLLKQELESVDFYIAQGYLDIARDTLDMLERQFGAHASIESRRQSLAGVDQPVAEPVSEFADFSEVQIETESFGDTVVAGQADAIFVMPVDSELEDTIQEQPFVSAEVIQTGTGNKAASNGSGKSGIDAGLAAIFDEFREAVEEDEPAAADGDFETHYNLGIAYKEMDLLDSAVEEFQRAAALVSPQDGTQRYLECCNMLGHCFMQNHMPRLAIMWFKKGLDTPGQTEDVYQALRYDLGLAYEEMGEIDTAIEVFTEVYGVSVSYRGVADRLRDLQAQRAIK